MDCLDSSQFQAHCAWDEYYNQLSTVRIVHPAVRGNGVWNHKHAKYFMRIGEECEKRQIDVRLFVQMMFAVLRQRFEHIPAPKALAHDNAFKIYADQTKTDNPGDPIVSWANQAALVEKAVRLQKLTDPADALISIYAPFTFWFRVLYLTPFNEKLFRMFGQEARIDLQDDQSLRAYLRQIVPANMQELERRLGAFGDI